MNVLVLVLFILIVIGALVAWIAVNNRQRVAEREAFVRQAGFQPCDAEADSLAEAISGIEHTRDYRYFVRHPYKTTVDGREVYFYRKSKDRRGRRWLLFTTEEFLIPLERKSSAPVVLYLKPTVVTEGFRTAFARSAFRGDLDATPDDTTEISLPEDVRGTNLIGALAPDGSGLYDVIEPERVKAFLPASDHGLLVIRCRDQFCAFERPPHQAAKDLSSAWTFVKQFVA